MYDDAILLIAFQVSIVILNLILALMESQCKAFFASIMCSYFLSFIIISAMAFCISWILIISFLGRR